MTTSAIPEKTPYELIGGEATIRALVDRFYQLMHELPEAWEVRKLHPQDLAGSNEKLFMYLSGWLGGPDLYVQRHGHPRLRARHLPFAIGAQERDQWLMCMQTALAEHIKDDFIRERLYKAMADLADFMRNTDR